MLPAPGAWRRPRVAAPAAVRVQGRRAEPAGQGGQHDRAAGAPAAPAVVGGELVGVGTVGGDGARAGDPARTDEHDAAAGRTVGVGRGEVVRRAGTAAAAEQRARPGRRHRCTTPAAGGLVGVPGVAADAATAAVAAATAAGVLVVGGRVRVRAAAAGVAGCTAGRVAAGVAVSRPPSPAVSRRCPRPCCRRRSRSRSPRCPPSCARERRRAGCRRRRGSPSPSTLTVPASVSVLATSSASTPPTEPSHGRAVSPAPVVAVVYDGTRTTWNVRCPRAPVAAAVVYVCSSPPPAPAPLTCTVPPTTADVAVTYSYAPARAQGGARRWPGRRPPPCAVRVGVRRVERRVLDLDDQQHVAGRDRRSPRPSPAPTCSEVAPAAAVPTPGK